MSSAESPLSATPETLTAILTSIDKAAWAEEFKLHDAHFELLHRHALPVLA